MDEKKKARIKKIIIAICMALSAIAGYVVKLIDGDPATVPDGKATIEAVKDAVDVIKEEPAE